MVNEKIHKPLQEVSLKTPHRELLEISKSHVRRVIQNRSQELSVDSQVTQAALEKVDDLLIFTNVFNLLQYLHAQNSLSLKGKISGTFGILIDTMTATGFAATVDDGVPLVAILPWGILTQKRAETLGHELEHVVDNLLKRIDPEELKTNHFLAMTFNLYVAYFLALFSPLKDFVVNNIQFSQPESQATFSTGLYAIGAIGILLTMVRYRNIPIEQRAQKAQELAKKIEKTE